MSAVEWNDVIGIRSRSSESDPTARGYNKMPNKAIHLGQDEATSPRALMRGVQVLMRDELAKYHGRVRNRN
jgi:hypothetical protein